MKSLNIRTVFITAFCAILTACGGADLTSGDDGQTGHLAAVVYSSGMPAPDCAPEGCSQARIIDGNAEQFRAAVQERAAEPVADAIPATPAPAEAAPAQPVQVLQ